MIGKATIAAAIAVAACIWADAPAIAQAQSPGCAVAWRRAQSASPATRVAQLRRFVGLCPNDRNAAAARAQIRVLERRRTVVANRSPSNRPSTSPRAPPPPPPVVRRVPPASAPGRAPVRTDGVYAEFGGWSVMSDRSSGCYLGTGFANGEALVIGFRGASAGGGAYLALTDPNWAREVRSGASYALSFRIDDQPEWTATGHGIISDDGTALMSVDIDEGDFLLEFAEGQRLRVNHDGHVLSDLSFTDAARALEQLLNCQEALIRG